jgi:rhamnulokinase
MIGGGIQDEYLCQLTADVTGKKIMAGPVEASAFGNIIMQLKAIGEIPGVLEGRHIIKDSISQKQYFPVK